MNQYQIRLWCSVLFFIGIVQISVKGGYFFKPNTPPFFLLEKAGLIFLLGNWVSRECLGSVCDILSAKLTILSGSLEAEWASL